MKIDITKLRHDESHNSPLGDQEAWRFLDESGIREWILNGILLVALPQKVCLHCVLNLISDDLQGIINANNARNAK